MGEGCKDVGLVGVGKEETSRVKLTEVNPHLVCVLCHGYFVDATTITECLHSFCRSCIFRHLETKSFCPICEVQVHARLHRSLKPDKTLQDIVYKLVPGLFHNEMERRRAFYKEHPFRDEHLEPERRGLGLDRLIYSPTDTISLSLEFYDTEREREEWSSVTCPPPHPQETPNSSSSNNNNNNKRYLQCPAIFKMAHLKKFLRQKYNLPPTANVEIIYKREFLPDSYSLMDVAYIYTWKRNGPMRFYYRIPDVVENIMPFDGKPVQENADTKAKLLAKPTASETPSSSSPTSDLERNKKVLTAANLPVETEEKKLPQPPLNQVGNNLFNKNVDLNVDTTISNTTPPCAKDIPSDVHLEKIELKNDISPTTNDSSDKSSLASENTCKKTVTTPAPAHTDKTHNNIPVTVSKQESTELVCSKENNKVVPLVQPKVSKQDELPVEVLLSLSTCRVAKEITSGAVTAPQKETTAVEGIQPLVQKPNSNPKVKHSSNARMSLTKIANELQQKAANNFIQKNTKENEKEVLSPSKNAVPGKASPNSKTPVCKNGNSGSGNSLNGRISGNKRKNNGSVTQGRHFFNDMGVMDHRIQQLYKHPGSPTSNGLVPVRQKTESRLANWLNNRFQVKPPGSPSHPGVNPSSLLHTALTTQLALTAKVNGTKPTSDIEMAGAAGINVSLQNAVNASIRASSQQTSPSPVGLYINRNHSENSQVPEDKSKSLLQNGKKANSEKRDKIKPPSLLPNGVTVRKELNSCKDLPANSTKPDKTNSNFPPICPKPPSPKIEKVTKDDKPLNNLMTASLAVSYVKDQGLVIAEPAPANAFPKDRALLVSTSPSGVAPVSKSPHAISSSTKEDNAVNGEIVKKVPAVTNVADAKTTQSQVQKLDPDKKSLEIKGDPSKLDEEVNRLKKKLEEMRKMSNIKGKEIGGCRITHENPDPEEAKRRRDLTPVVSIELMRGCKRPVPGLKAIQDIVDLGKRKGQDDRKDHSEKKLKLSTTKKEISKKKEETCALDLSRCGPPNPATPPHPWFNPLLHQQFLPSPK